MEHVSIPLRVFGLDVEVTLEAQHEDAVRAQWQWSQPDSPTQRTIEPLPGCGPVDSAPLAVQREDDAGTTAAHIGDYRLTTTITGAAITRCAGHYVMLHAGGVCDQESGRVAALIAESGTGKTTATRHFGSHGYGYVTDETVIVGAERAVLPYPKPLSLVIDASEPHEKSQHDPGELGLAMPRSGPLTLGPLVLLRRLDGDNRGRVDAPQRRDVYLLDGLAAVLPQSSAVPQIPDCLALLAELAQAGGGIHELRYTEIADAEHLLGEAFAAEPKQPFWRHVRGTWPGGQDADIYAPPATSSAAEARLDDGGRVERAPFVDALVDDERCEALVLLGATPARLSGIGAALWETCARPSSLADLVQACVNAFGSHTDAERLVRESVESMLSDGVLRPALGAAER